MSKFTKEELLVALKRLEKASGLAKLTRNEHFMISQDIAMLQEHLDCNCHKSKIATILEGPKDEN